jgi:hypothetical protein
MTPIKTDGTVKLQRHTLTFAPGGDEYSYSLPNLLQHSFGYMVGLKIDMDTVAKMKIPVAVRN